MPAKPFVIALEEHFQDPEVGATYGRSMPTGRRRWCSDWKTSANAASRRWTRPASTCR